MAKRNTEAPPDIYMIRKVQAETALQLAKETAPDTFIGDLNEQRYYLVIQTEDDALQVQQALDEKAILTDMEYRELSEDYVLYLKDAESESEEDDERE